MDDVSPEVTVRGPGEPVAAVVGGIHGDEPSGVRAVRRLRDADLSLRRAVAFVVANPPAVRADERYLDADLNRSFPGDPDGNREERLAAQLCEVTGDLPTLSLHATHSQPEPFALVDRRQPAAVELAAGLPVPHVVDHHETLDGAFTACGRVVTVEAGCQRTDEAARTAKRQAEAFLRLVDALDADPTDADPEFFAVHEPVSKPPGGDYELLVDNFERVPAGTTYATAAGEKLVADEPFYPVLMSECGYEDVFGYEGEKLGDTLDEVRTTLGD